MAPQQPRARPGRSGRGGPGGAGGRRRPLTVAQQHGEWVGLLRPDGPFIALPVLTDAFQQGLDVVGDGTLEKVRLAWAEVQAAPDLLNPAWCELILTGLLGYTPAALAEGGALPADLRAGPAGALRPDAVAFGPDGQGGRAERLLVYRLPWDTPLTRAGRGEPSPTERAAEACRRRGVPLALLTNGGLWALVHARPEETATTAVFDADLWLEERALIRAFASLLHARRVLPPARKPDGELSASLAALFARSAQAQAEVTGTLGAQVRQAVELLVGELSRLDRESDGAALGDVRPRQVYRAALTIMMRLVFLLYAEEQRLLPVNSSLYATAYSVAGLYDQLETDRHLHGDEIGDRRAAAWPRLLATFAAVHGGCEHDEMRIPPYGGGLFDPRRYPWLERLAVTDRVVHEMLSALLVLRRKGGVAERLSYKGLDVEQIGHVYEGLLEYSCLRVPEPYLGLFGKNDPELPLAEVEQAAEDARDNIGEFFEWLAGKCGVTATAVRKAIGAAPDDMAALHAACDNDAALAQRIRPLRGALRRDLRGLPSVFPAGSLVITQVGDRRATGTHYTPKALAEEIVQHTLAPLCHSPGPADGADPADWQVRPAGELLDLKVLDPAMGSGAFLVSACRYLAERVVQAWERDGYPDPVLAALGPDFDRDDALLEARRRVAARCLYGVDRDEAAVELGKLSLWLVTLAKDKPFSFLDHALRCGDSLVGLITESQVEAFHLDPETGRRINTRLTGTIDEVSGPILARVRELREEIEAEPVRDAQQAEALAAKLAEADRLTEKLRNLADAVAAAALSTAGQSEEAFNDRLTGLQEQVQRMLTDDVANSPLERALRDTLEPWLKGPRPEPIRPLHWALEFPEVMSHGGFHAIVSNPPFSGGKKVSGAHGVDYREYLKQRIALDKPGNADLCSYFLLRDLSVVAPIGRVGIIATNSIAQNQSRAVGLDQMIELGWIIYRAEKTQPWPGSASLEVSLLWVGHPGKFEWRILDGLRVSGITSSLDPHSRVAGKPYALARNSGIAFQGAMMLGSDFQLTSEAARQLIREDPKSSPIILPYLNGDDLNSRDDLSASRLALSFGEMTEQEARRYSACWNYALQHVLPGRLELSEQTYPGLKRRWWQYWRPRGELMRAIAGLEHVIVITLVSKTGMPVRVSTGQVFSNALGVFATGKVSHLAVLTSSMHFFWWTTKSESSLRADPRYTPSEGFETFPQPSETLRLEEIGERLDSLRLRVMRQRRLGLTALYRLVHDQTAQDEDFVRLREIHIEIDEAVREAYALDEEREPSIREFEARVASGPLPAWREIELGHGFHETRQGVRLTISPQARVDVLDKLLALNHYRYQQEVERGLHSGNGRGGARRRRAAQEAGDAFEDGALFPPDGALF